MTNVRLHIMSPPACIFSIVHSAQCSKIQFLYIKHIFRIARNIHVKNVEIKISQTFIRLQIAIDCTPYSLHDRLNSLMVFHTNQVSTSFYVRSRIKQFLHRTSSFTTSADWANDWLESESNVNKFQYVQRQCLILMWHLWLKIHKWIYSNWYFDAWT